MFKLSRISLVPLQTAQIAVVLSQLQCTLESLSPYPPDLPTRENPAKTIFKKLKSWNTQATPEGLRVAAGLREGMGAGPAERHQRRFFGKDNYL